MKRYFFFLLPLVTFSCSNTFYNVYPVVETDPVQSGDDAADDIAIFIHPSDDNKHAIVGTNKQFGLVVYDQTGKTLHQYPIGRVNNVDLRQNVEWNNEEITIVGSSNRTDNTITFFRINESDLSLEAIDAQPITSNVDEVYGFCMYKTATECYAFVVGKDGVVEQWLLTANPAGKLLADRVRTFDVGSQCEGIVADDELGYLYVGEELVGIWRYGANPDDGDLRTNIDLIQDNSNLKADVEGLTIYKEENGEGYLLVSSQGNNSYAVYERNHTNQYLGSFKIKSKGDIDGTSDTDGIDATSEPFGPYDKGIFVVQDGANRGGNQNFKVVDYKTIIEKIESGEKVN